MTMEKVETEKRNSHKNEFVKVTNAKTGEVRFFKNGMDASREIGFSHVLVYKALKNQGAEKGDWKFEYISKDDPQCGEFKKEFDDRMSKLRQSLVEYVHDYMLKRKEFVESEKAKRKAEHD